MENEEERDDELEDTMYSEEREVYDDLEAAVYFGEEGEDQSPDADIYLVQEDYIEPVVNFEEPGSAEEEETFVSLEYTDYCREHDSEVSDMIVYSDDEQSYENIETEVSLEEKATNLGERENIFKEVLSCLEMDRNKKLLPSLVQQFRLEHGSHWTPQTSADLVWNFLVKIQSLDVTARDAVLSQRAPHEDDQEGLITKVENMDLRDKETINPLDVLCAIMLCSDSSLQQQVLENMFKCHFALPLLLPDAENNKCILMLRALKNIVPNNSVQFLGDAAEVDAKSLAFVKMPLVSFVRLGFCSSSKSRILNAVLSPPQNHPPCIFHHRDSHASLLPRQISDGLVEITWCFSNNGTGQENPDFFQEPMAVANLRGDLECFWTQFGFLMEVSSAVFIFTDCPGEREWELLEFLGKTAKEKCYFILSPQSRESEEAQLFQRVLELKPSQLLLLEEGDMEDRGRYAEGLRLALKEVMRSPLRCVSVEDMASMARELGIQVDQECEKAQSVQATFREATAETDEVLQGQTQSRNLPERWCQMPVRGIGTFRTFSPQPRAFYGATSFTPRPWAWWLPPTRINGNRYQLPLRPHWVMGWPRCLGPMAFCNRRTNISITSPGRGDSKSHRSHQTAALRKSFRSPQISHSSRAPRPISQTGWVPYHQAQSKEILRNSRLVFQAGNLQTLRPWSAGTSTRLMRPTFHGRWSWNPRYQHVGVTKMPMWQASHSGQYQTIETSEKSRRPVQSQGSKLRRTSGQPKRQAFCITSPGTQRSQPSEVAEKPMKPSCHIGSSISQTSQPARTTGSPIRPVPQLRATQQHQAYTTKSASQAGHLPSSKPSLRSQAKPPQHKPSYPKGGPKKRGK